MALLLNVIRMAALAALAASLVLPLFETAGWGDASGAWALLLGWGYIAEGRFAWYANPVMLLCLFMLRRRPGVAVFLSAAALAVATLEYPYGYVQSLGFDSSREIEEGRVTGLGVAAYVWMASICLTLGYSLLRLISAPRAGDVEHAP